MNTLHRIFSYSRRYWKQLTLSTLTASLFGLFAAAPSYLLKDTIDTLFLKRQEQLILPFVIAFVMLFIFKELFMYISSYFMNWVGNKVINDIRQDLFEKIIHFPLSFYRRKNTGELMSHFLNDIRLIQNASSAAIKSGVRSIFEASALFIIAFMQNWKLTLLTSLIAPLMSMAISRMGRSLKKSAHVMQNDMSTISSHLQEVFVGIREIKIFNSEQIEYQRFSKGLGASFKSLMRNAHIEAIGPALIEVITMFGSGIIFYIAAQQVLSGQITPGELTSFFLAMFMAYQPIKRLVSVYSDIQNGIAAAERIFEVMDKKEIDHAIGTEQLPSFNSAIELHNVGFSYTSHNTLFSNLNLTILKGQRIALTGPSGAGKSTLCDLLLGLIQPSAGIISIDGIDLARLNPDCMRSHLSYVSQHPFLFNDTIKANIRYAKPHATDDEIVDACKKAYAHDFIMATALGYDSLVGENGTLLSGGQKQRLTIARALLKKPSILILDEATSSLDNLSEQMICNSINELSRDTTIIAISHRTPLIEKMDRIFTLKNKSLEELNPARFSTHPFQKLSGVSAMEDFF